MEESGVRQALISNLDSRGLEVVKEFHFKDCVTDFVIKNKNGVWYCVEVKGDRARETPTVGQLLHYYRHSSHVVLCATKEFIDKMKLQMSLNPELHGLSSKLGIFSINMDNQLDVVKEPTNSNYYFEQPEKVKPTKPYDVPKYGVLDYTDEFILNAVKEKNPILMGELHTMLKNQTNARFSMEALRKRLRNLVQFKHLKYVSKYATAVGLP